MSKKCQKYDALCFGFTVERDVLQKRITTLQNHVARLHTNLQSRRRDSVTTEQNELRHLKEDNAALRSKIQDLETTQKDDEDEQREWSPRSPLKAVKDIHPQNDSSPDTRRFCFTPTTRWKPAGPTAAVAPVGIFAPRRVTPYAHVDDYFLGYSGVVPAFNFRRCRSSPPDQNQVDFAKNYPPPASPRSPNFTQSVTSTPAAAVRFLPSMERVGSDYWRMHIPADGDVSNVSSPRSLRINYGVLMQCHPIVDPDGTHGKSRINLSAPGTPHSSGNPSVTKASPIVAKAPPPSEPVSPISPISRFPGPEQRQVILATSPAMQGKNIKPALPARTTPQGANSSHTSRLTALIAKQALQLEKHTTAIKTIAQRSAKRMRDCSRSNQSSTLAALAIGLPTCQSPKTLVGRRNSLRNRLQNAVPINSPRSIRPNHTRPAHPTALQPAGTPRNSTPRHLPNAVFSPFAHSRHPGQNGSSPKPCSAGMFHSQQPHAATLDPSPRKYVVPVPFRSLVQRQNNSMTHISQDFSATMRHATSLSPRRSNSAWNIDGCAFPTTNGSPRGGHKPKSPVTSAVQDKDGKEFHHVASETCRPRSFQTRPRKSLRPSLIPPGVPKNWRELCCKAVTGSSSKICLLQKYRWKAPLMVDCRLLWYNPFIDPPLQGEEMSSYQLKAQPAASRRDFGQKRSRWVAVKQKEFPVRERPEKAWTEWPAFGTMLFRAALAF
eukprot:GEMP01014849.1.p1 GENE.GEMP01014849.1~~GEMP01014849.1.p1  ORF type:complete len:719 (+),score=146.26 GEMP01014849.1:142-2298(+)